MLSKIFKTAQHQLSAQDYILSINTAVFEERAFELFHYQYAENELYRSYCNALHRSPGTVNSLLEIPFLPISFFKSHQVLSAPHTQTAALVFESSGTTGEVPSKHFVADETLYEASLLAGFRTAFGPPEEYTILALLPSYLERGNASLVHMARVLMAHSNAPGNGFYLNEWTELSAKLQQPIQSGKKVLLLGVTFALLDFADAFPMDIKGVTVMETGGMKGRREEWTRTQVHEYLCQQWNLDEVATEYGMTELLSQAYAHREGLLSPTPTMRAFVRDITDPLTVVERGSGALNIIDLANVYSCAFIATEDIGTIHDTNNFEVLGRLDYAALRGCSLMTA